MRGGPCQHRACAGRKKSVRRKLDGVADRLHAVQQGIDQVSAGSIVVIQSVEHFLIDAGAGSLQVVGLEQGVELVGNEAMTLPFASATSSLTAPAL